MSHQVNLAGINYRNNVGKSWRNATFCLFCFLFLLLLLRPPHEGEWFAVCGARVDGQSKPRGKSKLESEKRKTEEPTSLPTHSGWRTSHWLVWREEEQSWSSIVKENQPFFFPRSFDRSFRYSPSRVTRSLVRWWYFKLLRLSVYSAISNMRGQVKKNKERMVWENSLQRAKTSPILPMSHSLTPTMAW